MFLGFITVLAVCAASFAAWRILGSPMLGVDDAQIFFVYARNVVQGHGIVYSVGSGHVEGYSSVLYFLLCTASFALFHAPTLALLLINLVFAVLTSLCMLSVLNDLVDSLRLGEGARILFTAAYLLWILTNPVYFAWSVAPLMDTGIYSLLVTATFALLTRFILVEREIGVRQSIGLALLIGLDVLSRPEGTFWALLAIVTFLLLCVERYGSRRLLKERRFLPPVLAFLGTPLLLIAFRLVYFGYPLPNTYYAKVSSSFFYTYSAGHHYFIAFRHLYTPLLWIAPILAACILAIVLAANFRARVRITPLTAFAILSTACSLGALAGPVLEGGDHFVGFRMYQPLMPLLFLPALVLPLLALQLRSKPGPALRPLLIYAAVYAALFSVTSQKSSWASFKSGPYADHDAGFVRNGLMVGFDLSAAQLQNGERLRAFFHGNLPTVGVASAGGFAFGYQGPVFDMLGLNDVRMAHANPVKTGPIGHRSFDAGVFYQIAPDLLNPFSYATGEVPGIDAQYAYYLNPASWDNLIYKDLFHQPRFQAEYTFGLITDSTQPGVACLGFIKRSYLSHLLANPHLHVTLASNQ